MKLFHPFQNLFGTHGSNLFFTASPGVNDGVKDSSRWLDRIMPTLLVELIHVLQNSFGASRCRTALAALGPSVDCSECE